MVYSFLRPIAFLAAKADFVEPPVAEVVITGLVLVFSILVILTLLLTFQGKFFASLDKKKKEAADVKQAAPVVKQAAQQAVQQPAAPAVQAGIPPEVVAAITAAVASIEGGKYTLRSVSVAPQKTRGQWGLAGVISYTEPF